MNAMPPPAWWVRADAGQGPAAGFTPVHVPEELAPGNDLSAMLGALLAAQGWAGTPEHLAAAMPHMAGPLDVTGLRSTLANLGYPTLLDTAPPRELGPDELPAVLLPRHRPAELLFLDAAGLPHRLVAGAPAADATARLETGGAAVLRIARASAAGAARPGQRDFTAQLLHRFRPALRPLLLASLMLALLSLAMPLFTQAVFDMLIGGQTAAPLPMLLAGLILALTFEAAFRALRMRWLARIGARIDSLMACATLQQLLGLPLSVTERAGIPAQVARVRDFSTIREYFTGSLAIAALDAPFALLLVGVLALMAGPVALAPLGAAAALALLFLAVRGRMRRELAALAVASQERDQVAGEILDSMRLLRSTGAQAIWAGRHAAAATDAALAGARLAGLATLVGAASQAVTGLAALAAIAIGVHAVLAGSLGAGGLIASMMVIWRVLAPIQMAFTLASRWEQVRTSMRQADQMMALPPEREPGQVVRPLGSVRGDISLNRVSLRYLPQAEPALLGISLEIKARQVVAITGPSGGGKTTLLLTIMGLHRPTVGTVRIDGFDIRRFDPIELRQTIAYAPAAPRLLYGTIAQNLLLANRGASRAEMLAAARLTGLDRMVGHLPDGFETRARDNAALTMPAGLLLRLSLTRALLRPAPIVLLDEPANGLDDEGSAAVLRVIEQLRGRATVLMVTHRPSHVAVAERVLRLVEGELSELPRPGTPSRVRILSGAAPAAPATGR